MPDRHVYLVCDGEGQRLGIRSTYARAVHLAGKCAPGARIELVADGQWKATVSADEVWIYRMAVDA